MSDLEFFDTTGIDRVLGVVAHPDDMEYGASCAVAAWTAAGIDVSYLLLTAGEAGIRTMDPAEVAPLRRREQEAACAEVGVESLTILDFPDGLVEADHALRKAITRQIRTYRPQAIITLPWKLEVSFGLNHVDHRNVGLAVVDAIRDADNPWIFPELRDDEGLEAWKTDWLLVSGDEPTCAVDVTGEPLERGIASLSAHEVYLDALPGHPAPREMLEGMTTAAGERAGVANAVGFRAIQM